VCSSDLGSTFAREEIDHPSPSLQSAHCNPYFRDA
jgi:hypothetical protein